ncbi:MAG: WYL domain-containing protein [Clostridiales bacterium]|nr:WYL domain-containing protein [Clostridiales bacterium]MBR6484045.1 WYL domain-containing protein [Clostridiales bacterium]
MANSEKSKHKVLLLYDYFLTNLNGYDDENGATMKEILAYLENKTGYQFERKSVYSDIDRINEFMELTGHVQPGDKWITLEGNKYFRSELSDELSLDEARLIVDAIRTTPFTSSGLCEKIEKMYPSYFSDGYRSLVSHDYKVNKRTQFILNNIRTCIKDKMVLRLEYGYVIADAIRSASEKFTSPLALDWENSCYYLIAIDNDEYKKTKDINSSIRRYRVDRIKAHGIEGKAHYCDPGKDRDKILKTYLANSIDAFASSDSRIITILLKSSDEKTILRAYNAFADDVKTKQFLSDRTDRGELKFMIEAGLVPTLFTKLFMLSTFEGLEVSIDDEEVKEKFAGYLKKALDGLA